MATWDDVRRLALALPDTDEYTTRGHQAWRVHGRLFVWDRPLRKTDLAQLGDAAPDGAVLGARVEHLAAKEAMLADEPSVYFTTSHFDGHPIVLAQLDRLGLPELEEVVVEAWIARAPEALAREYVAARFGGEASR